MDKLVLVKRALLIAARNVGLEAEIEQCFDTAKSSTEAVEKALTIAVQRRGKLENAELLGLDAIVQLGRGLGHGALCELARLRQGILNRYSRVATGDVAKALTAVWIADYARLVVSALD